MKKVQKTLLLAMCGSLTAVIVSCATNENVPAAVGVDFGKGIPIVGEMIAFTDAADGGNSTVVMETLDIDGMTAYRFTGNITTQFQWGFVGWAIEPEEESLELLRNARAISFMTRGDGQLQTIKYRISSVMDHAYHEFHFTPTAETQRILVPIGMFAQPAVWGARVPMNQALVQDVSWQTHENWRPGTFDVTIWDVRIHY